VVLASGQRRWPACRRSGRCTCRVRVLGRGTVATRMCCRGGVARRGAELRALGGDYERLARVLRPPIKALVGAGQRCQHAQWRVTGHRSGVAATRPRALGSSGRFGSRGCCRQRCGDSLSPG
jgi:hypothetical protein